MIASLDTLMSYDSGTIQASEFDSKIKALDGKIGRTDKNLGKWKQDRDALIRVKEILCGDRLSDDSKDEEEETIVSILASGSLSYRDITPKLNERLGTSKSMGSVYNRLKRMAQEQEPRIQNIGKGIFSLVQTKSPGNADGASTSVDVHS